MVAVWRHSDRRSRFECYFCAAAKGKQVVQVHQLILYGADFMRILSNERHVGNEFGLECIDGRRPDDGQGAVGLHDRFDTAQRGFPLWEKQPLSVRMDQMGSVKRPSLKNEGLFIISDLIQALISYPG